MKLSKQHKIFADNYILKPNAYDAAIRAGYSENYAKAQSYKLLDNVGIKAYIQQRIDKKDKKRIMAQDEVLELYSKIARGEEQDINVNGFGIEQKVSPALRERIKALDALAKRYGLDKAENNNDKDIFDKLDEVLEKITGD